MKKDHTPQAIPPAVGRLLDKAREAARHAYAPYSRFVVGAAVETTGGKVFTSANMENASYGVTACAELGALQGASAAGRLHEVRRIAVVGGPVGKSRRSPLRPTAPCGRCRQLIVEAAVLGGTDVEIWYADLDLRHVERGLISELLKDSFDASHLGGSLEWRAFSELVKARLDEPAPHVARRRSPRR